MKRVIAGAAVLLAGLAVLWGVRVYQVNRKYPKDEVHRIAYGDAEMVAENVSMKVVRQQWISFAEANGEYVEEELSEEGYYYVAEVLLVNEGTEEAKADLTQLNLETNGYFNGIALDIFIPMNEEPTLYPDLQPGENRSVLLTYTIYDFQWKPKDWKQVREREYLISRYDYPDKWCWELQ